MDREVQFQVADGRFRSVPEGKEEVIIETRGLSVYYGYHMALYDINLPIYKNRITAFIGPSGCGKSTLLRCFNRMNEVVADVRIEGEVLFHGKNVYDPDVDPVLLRRRIGMVFQQPNPFPKSIYDNVAYGPRMYGIKDKATLDEIVEESLRAAALWDEVKDVLGKSALALSGGQQQRLCIARTIAVKPEVILMDEPASALDPISTARIEELMQELARQYTIVIVTHNMQQAARVSDYTAFLYLHEEWGAGYIEEFGPTKELFLNPKKKRTEDYISGKFG
ncbi:phosphate ABC transporter, ATPase subunit [Spirochaeta thermophila DSM 6578]|uniref:Phosphate ABC transporter, ATPase subunit n=1 Tax=Winmispira thermophila (strain ATCC 700085 / DSM 6578 / Z-1203) TaxID=869211 RepID=G0G9T5_WINT7|nr:phosphate ABC transporter ATP-binding protein PstB [Spirochaeta thermophila]AEJ60835.1 phosphate ABC transporter, ATPase subunit [Spirochaeta thermophila DSM 6578]